MTVYVVLYDTPGHRTRVMALLYDWQLALDYLAEFAFEVGLMPVTEAYYRRGEYAIRVEVHEIKQ